MSLDVTLTSASGEELYSANITHNLNKMALEAGIYECLWRPEEIGITHARQIIEPLTDGVVRLATDKARFEAFDAPNGWGRYINFLPWCVKYLQACKDHPDALVSACR